MGPRLADSTRENFICDYPQQTAVVEALRKYVNNLADEYRQGNGIVLFGPSGTGKDHLLVAAAKYGIRKHGLVPKRVFGVNLYRDLRDRMDTQRTEAEWVDNLTSPDILILSDPIPPRGGLSDYQAAMLQSVIDGRYNACRPTWCTLNVKSSTEADERMGAALVDRLKHGALTAYCNWPTYRKPNK